jgi:hypothetical protein
MHVAVDVCAKAPLGTSAAAAKATTNDHSGGIVDRKNKDVMGKAKWA